ncbi:MAG: hypothetical protein ACLP52_14650 [Streptosporangiaceae bacterium]
MTTPATRRPAPSGIGAQRRIRALMARAWSSDAIEHATGLPVGEVRRALADRRRVSPQLAAAVARVYDQLWDTEPPRATPAERAAADAHREHAKRCGWPPPMAYDDDTIDLPDGHPAPGWKRTSRITIPAADLAEDARWLRELGGFRHASPAELAMRLGVTKAALDKALARTRQGDREAG